MKTRGEEVEIGNQEDRFHRIREDRPLSQNISVAVIGCSSTGEVQILAGAGRDFQPLSAVEQQEIIDRFRICASRLAYFCGVLGVGGRRVS